MRHVYCKLFVCIIQIIIVSGPVNGSEEAESLIDAILQAYEAQLLDIGTGLGSATFLMREGPTGYQQTEELTDIRFWYKGEKRRTDFFETATEVDAPKRLRSVADNGEVLFSYNTQLDRASISTLNPISDRGWFGKDFHPSTLLTGWRSLPAVDMLRLMKEKQNQDKYKPYLQRTNEGFIELAGKSEEKLTHQNKAFDAVELFSFVFDPKHAFRPVSYYIEQQNTEGPGSAYVLDVKIRWLENNSGVGYPKSIEFSSHSVLSDAELEKGPPEGLDEKEWLSFKDRESYWKIIVEEFQQNTEIDDKLFTLEGMGTTGATLINDHILGSIQRYGSVRIAEEQLDSLLNESKEIKSATRETNVSSDLQIKTSEDDLSEDEMDVHENISASANFSRIGLVIFVLVSLTGCVICLYAIKYLKRLRHS